MITNSGLIMMRNFDNDEDGMACSGRREYWRSSSATAKVPGNVTPLLLIIVIIIIAIIAIINYTISTIAVVVLLISIIKKSSRLTPILTSFQVLLD